MSAVDKTNPERATTLTARGMKTRRALLDAAKAKFSRDGFSGTRISDIAEEAGTAVGSFYRYFESKDEIFLTLLGELEEVLWHRREEGPPESDGAASRPRSHYEQIYRTNRSYLSAYLDNREMMMVWQQVATFNPLVEAYRRDAMERFAKRASDAIEAWQAEGAADPSVDATSAGLALTGMVSNFVYQWSHCELDFDLELVVEQMTIIWANALGLARDP